MFGFLKSLFRPVPKVDYDRHKKMMTSENVEDRRALARNNEVNPEILFYLAGDRDVTVRRAVAANKATPAQASSLLARDGDVDVRLALAARLIDLLPNVSKEKHSQLYAFAVQALGMLAQDEVLKIRKALSTALKDHAYAPPQVAGQLARDVERDVSEPILLFCAALSDDDLLDILSSHPEPWVISAIAARPEVSEPVSEQVIESEDYPANTILISNTGAAFTEESLGKIIEQARQYPEWHGQIAMRKELSLDLARELSGFVSESVLKILEQREDFDAETRQEIAGIVQRRMEFHRHNSPHETTEEKVDRYIKANRLTPDIIRDAMAWQDDDFVVTALARRAGVHPHIVKKMLGAQAGKPVVALCWKAKLPMRLAVDLQKELAKVPVPEIIYAKGGTDYPLTPDEIKWQLEFYGIEDAA